MPLILNIETATSVCSVGLAEGQETLSLRESDEKNIHAARVTTFVEEVCAESGVGMNQLDAIAISMGPGSYTGLRIGVSAAKGLGYALEIPLISVPTLQALALRALHHLGHSATVDEHTLFCPMIDARRMEVYTALYDKQNRAVRDTEALIIDKTSFDDELQRHKIYYFGDGAPKCQDILETKGMILIEALSPSAKSMAYISSSKFENSDFEDIAYFEPFYLKDFIAGKPRVKGLE